MDCSLQDLMAYEIGNKSLDKTCLKHFRTMNMMYFAELLHNLPKGVSLMIFIILLIISLTMLYLLVDKVIAKLNIQNLIAMNTNKKLP